MVDHAGNQPSALVAQDATLGMDALSDDLALQVFSHLGSHSLLANAAQVSQRWRSLACSDMLWESLYKQSYPRSKAAGLPSAAPGYCALGHGCSPGRGDGPATAAQPSPTFVWQAHYRWKHTMERNWQSGRRFMLGAWEGHRAWVNAVRMVPDGRSCVSAGADHVVVVWDADGRQRHTITDHGSALWCCDVGTSLLASGDVGGCALAVDLATGAVKMRIRGERSGLPVAEVPGVAGGGGHGGAAGAGGGGGAVGAPSVVRCFSGVQVLPGEQQLLTVQMRGAVCCWDLRTGRAEVQVGAGGGAGPRRRDESLFSGQRVGGEALVVGDSVGRLHMYDVRLADRRVSLVQAHTPGSNVFALTARHGRVATGGGDGLVMLWDVRQLMDQPSTVNHPNHHLNRGLGFDVVADPPAVIAAAMRWMAGQGGPGIAGAHAEDGTAAGGGGGGWQWSHPACLGAGVWHQQQVFSVSLSDEWQLASASEDGTVAVWDTRSAGSPGAGCTRLRRVTVFAPSTDSQLCLRSVALETGQQQAALPGGAAAAGGAADAAAGAAAGALPPWGDGDDDGAEGTAGGDAAGAAGYDDEHSDEEAPDDDEMVEGEDGAGGSSLEGLSGCAMHGVDVSCEGYLVVGGRDALVRLYTMDGSRVGTSR